MAITHQLDDALVRRCPPRLPADPRTLRLVFREVNRDALADSLLKVPAPVWLGLYKAALSNEFLAQAQCVPSLVILRSYLTKLGLLDDVGRATL